MVKFSTRNPPQLIRAHNQVNFSYDYYYCYYDYCYYYCYCYYCYCYYCYCYYCYCYCY